MNDFLHQPYYCEENVWHLCQHPRLAGHERLAVWIMAPSGHCPLWGQKAALAEGEEPVFWDYHVLALVRENAAGPWQVWDLDTTLGFPSPLHEYLRAAFPFAGRLPPEFEPRFRLVPADDYVRLLASDRSHMKDHRGRWRKPPPPWPRIGASPNTLARFCDLRDPIAGRIVSLEELRTL